MNIIRIFAAGLAGLFLATPASAKTVDQYGVVVFTQADVDAGGITPGDTPGFPASILVSGSYRLGSPLTVTTLKNGIVISAPAVTLDLGGFKVSGAAVGRNGIYTDQIDTTVMNGIVRGFQNGIFATSEYLTVNGVSATNNSTDGLSGYDTKFARVRESMFAGNGAFGVRCGSGCSIQNSTVSTNGFDGLFMRSGGSILGNIIDSNTRYGISIENGARGGYGNTVVMGNGMGPVTGVVFALQPNACDQACPAPAP